MHEVKDMLWTWLLPDVRRNIDRQEWTKSGGKWIIFDKKNRIVTLAGRLGPMIDSGEIESAKYWNKDQAPFVFIPWTGTRKEHWISSGNSVPERTGYGNTITRGTRISGTRQISSIPGLQNSGQSCRVTVWPGHCN